MAIQYARKMGFEVIVIARGCGKERAVFTLGAHRYIDALREDALERLKDNDGVDFILATVPDAEAVSTLLTCLGPPGKSNPAGYRASTVADNAGHDDWC